MKFRPFLCRSAIVTVAVLSVVMMATALYAQNRSAAGTEGGSTAQAEKTDFSVPLKKGEDPTKRFQLDHVVWNGDGVDMESLEGKTVLLFTYGTQNMRRDWMLRDLFRQLMVSIEKRPIVVLAINAEPRDATMRYMMMQRFMASNIVHGYDPEMTARLGNKSEHLRYVWVDPKGKVKEEGYMGTSKLDNPDMRHGSKTYTLAKKLYEEKEVGQFEVIQTDFPDDIIEMLWPLELGQPIDGSVLKEASRTLKGDQKAKFEKALDAYLNRQVQKIVLLTRGKVPDQLKAYSKADLFVKQFRAFSQAKPVRKILNALKKDRGLKKEIAAMLLYQRATAKGVDPMRRLGMLKNLVRQYEDTYYGLKAADEIKSDEK